MRLAHCSYADSRLFAAFWTKEREFQQDGIRVYFCPRFVAADWTGNPAGVIVLNFHESASFLMAFAALRRASGFTQPPIYNKQSKAACEIGLRGIMA